MFPDHAAFDENPKTGGEKYFVRVQQKGKKRTFSQYNRTRQDNRIVLIQGKGCLIKSILTGEWGRQAKQGTGDSFISAGLSR